MICLRCNSPEGVEDHFVEKLDGVVKQIYREEVFFVITPVMVCQECGWETVSIIQADELVKRTKAAYQRRMETS